MRVAEKLAELRAKNLKGPAMTDFFLSIVKATVVLTDATDHVTLFTKSPCPFVATSGTIQPLTLDFKATHDTGADYVRNVFGIEPEIINIRK